MLRQCRHVGAGRTSSASIVSSSNMAATSLSFDSLGIDCKPSIAKETKIAEGMGCVDCV